MNARGHVRLSLISLLAIMFIFASMAGCSPSTESPDEKPEFSNAGYICELSTLEVYYHNVARAEHEAVGPFNHGYKRMWFEYSGVVEIGIDFSKVSISGPNASNVVTVTLPQAEILDVDVAEDSITEPAIETGFLTDFTTEEKTDALSSAQESMRQSADQDETLKHQARERARTMLESYITNVGYLVGETYSVVWVDV